MGTIGFTKNNLPYGWMSNMSPYPINFGGVIYRTVEALFQALRFSDNEIKELIRAEKSPMAAKFVAKARASEMVVEQLSEKDVNNMKVCVNMKIDQHPQLLLELIETGDDFIVEDVTSRGKRGSNLFWGAMLVDGVWIGENTLGKIWMEIRKEHQSLASK